jgi:shikimate dehydrogenase
MSKKACIVGWPIEHSRSPIIHSHWLSEYGIDGSYTKMAVPPGELKAFISSMDEKGYSGCNVTVPHKVEAFEYAMRPDDAALSIGAANTLWFEDGELYASNTDCFGFLANLDERAPGWDKGATTALVLGAGGAARAVLCALISRSFKNIILTNRTRSNADALAAYFKGPVRVEGWESRDALLPDTRLVVNTTTLGMTGQPQLELDISKTSKDTVVTDLVYAPLKTQLLGSAETEGLRSVDGLGMLIHQAVPGFEKWFGVRPEVNEELRNLLIADLAGS